LIKDIDPKALERFPKDQRPQIVNLVASVAFQFSHFSGPLPPPETLARYEQVLPGAADRIFKMAESQSSHRQALEANTIGQQVRQSGRGQLYALFVSLALIGGAVWLSLAGHPIVGGLFGGGTLIGTVTVFITGKRVQVTSLAEKSVPIRRKK
jgi:uncharacterized membrane protein